jgi:hypothetical protein
LPTHGVVRSQNSRLRDARTLSTRLVVPTYDIHLCDYFPSLDYHYVEFVVVRCRPTSPRRGDETSLQLRFADVYDRVLVRR